MPIVQYQYPAKQLTVNKSMPTPKWVGSLSHWIMDARKVIPAIPEVLGPPDKDGRFWREYEIPVVTVEYIRLTYVNDQGDKAYLVIARKQ